MSKVGTDWFYETEDEIMVLHENGISWIPKKPPAPAAVDYIAVQRGRPKEDAGVELEGDGISERKAEEILRDRGWLFSRSDPIEGDIWMHPHVWGEHNTEAALLADEKDPKALWTWIPGGSGESSKEG